MRLIIECGATKSHWRVVSPSATEQMRLSATGINLSTMPLEAIVATINKACQQILQQGLSPTHIHLYAAGIASEHTQAGVKEAFGEAFAHPVVEIQDDLTAAARALYGNSAGIVAILGTGSNACLYDGEKIAKRVYSGGFILGDEGSAATLGKLFLADLLKGLIPKSVAEEFYSRFNYDYPTIVQNIYRGDSPSAFLGALAPFIVEHYCNPYIKALVDGNFRNFIRRALLQLNTEQYSVGVVGGFGYALKDILQTVANEEGITISRFVASPIQELVKYHTL